MPVGSDSSAIEFSPRATKIVTVISVAYCVFEIAYAIGLLRTEVLHLYPGTFRSIVLAVILILTFILRPAKSGAPRNKIPWYDYALMAASLPHGPVTGPTTIRGAGSAARSGSAHLRERRVTPPGKPGGAPGRHR